MWTKEPQLNDNTYQISLGITVNIDIRINLIRDMIAKSSFHPSKIFTKPVYLFFFSVKILLGELFFFSAVIYHICILYKTCYVIMSFLDMGQVLHHL